MKKVISVILCMMLISTTCLAVSSCDIKQGNTPDPKAAEYENALVLLANCDYVGAKAAFEALGHYKDAKEYLSKFYYMPISFEYDLIDKKGTNDVAYNSLNLPISETTIRSDVQAVSKFVYDDKGNIIEQITIKNTEADPEISRYVYTYDIDGYLASANYTGYDGYVAAYTFWYDDKGNNTKQIYVDGYGTYEYLMTYDENGNCAREVFTDADGEQSAYDYTYDEHGNVVKEVFTDSDGNVQYVNTKYELLYIPCGITDGTDYFFRGLWKDRL